MKNIQFGNWFCEIGLNDLTSYVGEVANKVHTHHMIINDSQLKYFIFLFTQGCMLENYSLEILIQN